MAGLTLGGIGSGMDIKGMTEQLVAAERAPKQERINEQKSDLTLELTSYGQIKSSASELQDLLDGFYRDKAFQQKTISSSNEEFLGVEVDDSASNGAYSIEVKQLAERQKLATGFALDADPSAHLGTGKLKISVGDNAMTLSLTDENNSLKDVVDAINQSDDNPGLTASIVTDDAGARIIFNAHKTGSENAITIDASGIVGELSKLDYDSKNRDSEGVVNSLMLEQVNAQDAAIVIDGFATVTSSTNTFSDAIEGVTLDVKKLTDMETGSINVKVGNDTAGAQSAIQGFVDGYNGLAATVDLKTKYDSENETAAPLVGDSTARSLMGQLRNMMGQAVMVDDQEYYLSDFGITSDRYGRLEIDQRKLGDALDENFAAFEAFFMGDDGYLKKSDSVLEGFVGRDGALTNRENSIETQQDRLDQELETLDERMEAYEARLYRQFSAMDEAVGTMTNELNAMYSLMGY